jgi:hypothetical protein
MNHAKLALDYLKMMFIISKKSLWVLKRIQLFQTTQSSNVSSVNLLLFLTLNVVSKLKVLPIIIQDVFYVDYIETQLKLVFSLH